MLFFRSPYKNKEVLIAVLVEHKSHPDPKVFSQLLRYQRLASDEACTSATVKAASGRLSI